MKSIPRPIPLGFPLAVTLTHSPSAPTHRPTQGWTWSTRRGPITRTILWKSARLLMSRLSHSVGGDPRHIAGSYGYCVLNTACSSTSSSELAVRCFRPANGRVSNYGAALRLHPRCFRPVNTESVVAPHIPPFAAVPYRGPPRLRVVVEKRASACGRSTTPPAVLCSSLGCLAVPVSLTVSRHCVSG
jgi:hypothetical protein